jgi:hypothetical protein
MARFGTLGTQYFDNAGDPLVSGKIFFYESGTTTPKDTFADINLSIVNPNPVVLTAAGRQPNIFFNGAARAVLTDKDSVQIEVRDPVGGEFEEGVFSPWNPLTIYNTPDIVTGSDGNFYLSISNGNQNNDPTTSPANWEQIKFIEVWNPNYAYPLHAVAQGSDGFLYVSQSNGNLNNDPTTDTVNWVGGSNSGGGGSGGALRVQRFTTNGTWTQPAGVTGVLVIAVGGGQGGMGARTVSNISLCGGGGGGGQVIERYAPVSANVTVVVGLGGAGGVAPAGQGVTAGTNGGDTVLSGGLSLTAKGGGTGGNGRGQESAAAAGDKIAGGGGGAAGYQDTTTYGTTVIINPDITLYANQFSPGKLAATTTPSPSLAMVHGRGVRGLRSWGGGGCGGQTVVAILGGMDAGGNSAWTANTAQPGGAGGSWGGGGGGASIHNVVGAVNGGDGGDGSVTFIWWE